MIKKTKAVAKIQEDKRSFILEKLKMPRVFIILIVVIIAGLLFYFKGLFVAAVVNGEPITRLSLILQLEKKDGKQRRINQRMTNEEKHQRSHNE